MIAATGLEAILSDYFITARRALDDVYDWEVPKNCPFDFQRGSDSCAQANMRLRRVLSKIWKNEPTRRPEIATWYVRDWGGIISNRKETIDKYVCLSEADLTALNMQGVATWSKILAVQNPDTYAIFDARVSAALNAIQLAKGVETPILFPRLSSRNTKITKFQKWLPIRSFSKRRPTYRDYILLLTAVSQKSGAALEEVEMVLFANAEALVAQFIAVLQGSATQMRKDENSTADYLSAEFIAWFEEVRVEQKKRIGPQLDAMLLKARSLRLQEGHKARERTLRSLKKVRVLQSRSQAAE